jgi:hypothetical protein
MTPRAALSITVSQVFTYLAILVGLSGALETYVLHVGGPVAGTIAGDALQGLALALFVYQHAKLTGQSLSLQNVASVIAVIVGASGAIQAYFVHIGGAEVGTISGSVLQGLALVLLFYQQVSNTPTATKRLRRG